MEEPAVPEPSPLPDFALLGPLSVVVEDIEVRLGGRRQSAVLARLVLSQGLVVSMDELVENVWDGDVPSRPEVAVRSYVSNLRRRIEPYRDRGDRRSCIESVPPGYRLVADPQQFDYIRFEALLADGRSRLTAGDATAAVSCFERADGMWRGEPCDGLVDTDAVLAFRSRLGELRLSALEHSADARLALGLHEAVISDLELATTSHPLRERLTELVMLALYRAGRQSDALAACRTLHERLLDRLGVTPGRGIQELEYRILNHDPALMPSGRDALSATTTKDDPGATSNPHPEQGHRSVEPDRQKPSTFGDHRRNVLVGREDEHRLLEGVTGTTHAGGQGGALLLTGEPGSGKTFLVAEHCLTLTGAAVSWGRSRSLAQRQPLWPWAQLLDGLEPWATTDDAIRLEEVSARIAKLESTLGPQDETDGASDPTALFRPVVELLRSVSARSPVILILDDAHWADWASLELLAFAASALADDAVVFIAIWRGTEPTNPASPLRELARLPGVTRIDLGPLSCAAVEQLVENSGLNDRDLARQIHRESGGNAFYVTELVTQAGVCPSGAERSRDTNEAGPLELAPTSNLEDSIIDRLESSHGLGRRIAAVAGLHDGVFTAEVLAAGADVDQARVEDALDALVRSGLVAETTSDQNGYRFVHPITAKVARSELSALRRARIHASIGHAMWRSGWPAADLAYHFFRAGSESTSILAARFALEWGQDDLALEKLPEIADIVTQGLEVAQRLDPSDPLETELASFLAQVARAQGQRSAFDIMARRAVLAARRSGDPELQVKAALAATGSTIDEVNFSRAGWVVMEPSDSTRSDDMLSEALGQLSQADPLRTVVALRRRVCRADAKLEGGLPPLLIEVGNPSEIGIGSHPAIEERAIEMAFLRESARLLVERGPATDRTSIAERLEEAVAAAVEPNGIGYGHDLLLALRLRMATACEEGNRNSLEALLNAPRSDLRTPANPAGETALDLDRRSLLITGDLIFGELERAGRSLEVARTTCRRAAVDQASFDRQLLLLHWEHGRFDEMVELAELPSTGLDHVHRQAILALGFVGGGRAGAGDRADARAFLKSLTAATVGCKCPSVLLACIGALMAYRLEDRDAAERISAVLRPRSRSVVSADGGLTMFGLGSYYAGVAFSAAGDTDRAARQLRWATERARQLGAKTWLCRSLVAEAEVAAASRAPRSVVDAYLDEARALAIQLEAGWFDDWVRI